MAEWTRSCRKALGTVLEAAMAAASPAIAVRMPGLAFDPDDHAEYVRFSNHPAKPAPITMGPTPRIQAAGLAKVGVFTQLAIGQDRNDTIAGLVRAAFPYNLNLDRDGIRVIVDVCDHGDYIEHDAWGYSPLDVHWTVWRTT